MCNNLIWSLITAILTGGVAALISGLFMNNAQRALFKHNLVNRKNDAASFIENVLGNLIEYEYYYESELCVSYSIYRDIENLIAFQKLLKKSFIYNYAFTIDIESSLRQIEKIIDNSVNEYYLNRGNDEFVLLYHGKDCTPVIYKIKQNIRILLETQYFEKKKVGKK